jgi:oxygen-independent coproporphyrinogen III oxidase
MLNLIEQYKPSQGIYIHIPHCLQKCHYCDFPTVLLDQGPDLDHYTSILEQELEFKLLKGSEISSIYFGGGTPSLMGPKRIDKILNKILSLGYTLKPGFEITIEINPGTLSKTDILDLKSSGVNRFSIGIQTFNDITLKIIGREHSSKQSLQTLELIQAADVPFTADLILALPGENFSEFKNNANTLFGFNPNHLSVYVLTVPELNFLSKNMPKDDLLDELMDESEDFLSLNGFERYEISNYRKKNHQPSLHNLLYWNDLNYWGVGLGAHSYLKDHNKWGLRFWNPRVFSTYEKQIKNRTLNAELPPKAQLETLQLNESLTDFCFTHLRQWDGISEKKLELKYNNKIKNLVIENLQILLKDGYIDKDNTDWRLSKKGRKFADHVFRQLCFSNQDMEDINE